MLLTLLVGKGYLQDRLFCSNGILVGQHCTRRLLTLPPGWRSLTMGLHGHIIWKLLAGIVNNQQHIHFIQLCTHPTHPAQAAGCPTPYWLLPGGQATWQLQVKTGVLQGTVFLSHTAPLRVIPAHSAQMSLQKPTQERSKPHRKKQLSSLLPLPSPKGRWIKTSGFCWWHICRLATHSSSTSGNVSCYRSTHLRIHY